MSSTDREPHEVVGYTAGVFDLFHVGHMRILQRASAMCDRLVVGVTTDELSLSDKNKAPVISFEERSEIVTGIKGVDAVVPQSSMNKLDAWDRLRFNRIFVGDDWRGTDRWIDLERRFKERGVEIVYFPYTTHTSSSLLRTALERLAQS